jgi:formylglycine-generating enzyme required for sulfatase activity
MEWWRMETEMRDDSETIGQWKTVGGADTEPDARMERSAAETVGQIETLGGGGRVLLAGRYRVVRRLGEGGMGSVWLAEDTKLDGRRVAIKMLPSVLAGKKGAYRQVKAEALMAMKLSHSNIATVRGFEEDEGGNPFLVMDYIEGEGLDDILAERGPLGEEETLRLLGPVAAALDYAHSQGVVHRDVKPGNVMVAKDGTPYVLDFGIAREVQETLTRVTGKLSSGTLLYMSPEQLNGDAPKAAQDVYSFAAMAYECLAGHAPFFRGAIEDQIKHKAPEALPKTVGEALRRGVAAGLAKEPALRPRTCAGLLGGKEARVVDSGKRAIPCARPRAKSILVTGMMLGALLGVAVLLVWGGIEGKKVWMARTALLREEKAQKEESRRQEELREVAAALASWEQGTFAGETKTIILPGNVPMDMVWCPPGEFTMGSPSWEEGRSEVAFWDNQCHVVTLTKGFWLAKHEVTQAQWRSVMGTGMRQHRDALFDDMTSSHPDMRYSGGAPSWYPLAGEGDDYPMYWVSWNEAQEFCRKIGLQLPTEAQWEYACRAGSTLALPNGNIHIKGKMNAPLLNPIAWYGGNSSVGWCGDEGEDTSSWEEKQYPGGQAGAHPVGLKEPNAWGFYDMIGNVTEWCADGWSMEESNASVTNPVYPTSTLERVLRGGSWCDSARACRSAARHVGNANWHRNHWGFRPAKAYP